MDSKKPAEWNPEQMETEDGEGETPSTTGGTPDVETWNEGQMAPAREDGTRSGDVPEAEIAESKGGLSGGGANPGGGERWADQVDDTAK
ncbi:MAG: hypothetical protein ABIP77_08415 [Candidatus Limnocylindrales bacterium]